MGMDWGQVFRGYVPTAMALSKEDEDKRRWEQEQTFRRSEADRVRDFQNRQVQIAEGQFGLQKEDHEGKKKREATEEGYKQQELEHAKRWAPRLAAIQKGDFSFVPEFLRDQYNPNKPPFNDGRAAIIKQTGPDGSHQIDFYDPATFRAVGSQTYTPAQMQRMAHEAMLAELRSIRPRSYAQEVEEDLKRREIGAKETTAGAAAQNAATQEKYHLNVQPEISAANNLTSLRIANVNQAPQWAGINDRRQQDNEVGKIGAYYVPRLDAMQAAVLGAGTREEQEAALRAYQLERGRFDDAVALARRQPMHSASAVGLGGGKAERPASEASIPDALAFSAAVTEAARMRAGQDRQFAKLPPEAQHAWAREAVTASMQGLNVKGMGQGIQPQPGGMPVPSAEIREAAKKKAGEQRGIISMLTPEQKAAEAAPAPVSGRFWTSRFAPEHVLMQRAAAGDVEAQRTLEAEQLRRQRLGAR